MPTVVTSSGLSVASTSEPLRQASHRVFESWLTTLTSRLVDAGIDNASARSVAVSVVAVPVGTFLLSRAARTTEAMTATGDAAVALVEAALGR